MDLSILQLKEYAFLNTQIVINHDYEVNLPYTIDAKDINSNVSSLIHDNNDFYVIKLELEITSENAENANLPYIISLTSVGEFAVSEKYEKDKEQFAVVNGASLLYSAMREYLMFITSRYPYGSIMLPTVHFQGLIRQDSKK